MSDGDPTAPRSTAAIGAVGAVASGLLSEPTSGADAAALADQAWLLVIAEPALAQTIATRALELAEQKPVDAAAASTAHRALGMASIERDDADTSVGHLRRAIVMAKQADDRSLLAEAEMSLALALQHRGEATAALRHAAAAHALSPGSARLGLQRALLLERLGRGDEALDAYREVEGLAAAAADRHTLVRMHCNRGVLLTYRGVFPEAERDLLIAERLCTELGLVAMSAGVRSNLGFLAARRGNLVEALGRLEADRAEMQASGGLRHGIHDLDRCEVFLLAGLPRDAADAGQAAIATFEAAGMLAEAAEAQVLTAQAALRAGELMRAEALAEAAAAAFRRQRRAPWLALAREVVVRAQWAGGRRDAPLLERARRVADALDEAGWPAAAASARLLCAQLAIEIGKTGRARTELRRASAQRTGPVGVRVQARHAEALLRLVDGNPRGAKSALRAGWNALEEHRATLGATELRVGAGAHAVELSALGLKLALESRKAGQVLAWAERGRAGALFQPPAQAPQDTPIAAALDALRTVVADLDAAAKASQDTRTLVRRQAALEAEVRRHAQLAAAASGGLRRTAIDPAEVASVVGDQALVEFVISDGALHAVVVADGRPSLHALGSAQAAAKESGALRMALGRLARAGAPAPLRLAAAGGVTHAAAALSAQLFTPLRARIEGRSLVIVPTGALHGTPWAALPGIHADQTVAPSATLWARGRRPSVSDQAAASGAAGLQGRLSSRGVLLAAGPGLAHADAEVAAIAALYVDPTALSAEQATVEKIRRELPAARLAHIACHGQFRGDNPLFSALELTGGHLSVFELEQLSRVPERLVLSACDSGVSAVHPGDELLGLTAALLRLGTRSLVASVLPVPDEASRRLMVELHRGLVGGASPSSALARARAAGDPDADDDRVAAAAFQAFGTVE